MKIVATLVGIMDHHRHLTWPEGWPVPREGDTVHLPHLDERDPAELSVRTVVWYPEGDDESEGLDREPFVYLVVGQARR